MRSTPPSELRAFAHGHSHLIGDGLKRANELSALANISVHCMPIMHAEGAVTNYCLHMALQISCKLTPRSARNAELERALDADDAHSVAARFKHVSAPKRASPLQ